MSDEEREAIGEDGRIATPRLAELLVDLAPLWVCGRLSTHVLDTHAGCSGENVEVALSRSGELLFLAKAITNKDGRTDPALIEGRPLPIGHYELRFAIAAYYRRRGVPLNEPPLFDVVPIRFGIDEPESHPHVPLLLTPWSYTSYRGSWVANTLLRNGSSSDREPLAGRTGLQA